MTQKDAEEKAAGFVIYKKSMLACALKLVHNRQVASAWRGLTSVAFALGKIKSTKILCYTTFILCYLRK